MIGKIFLTEKKEYLLVCCAGLLVCLLAAVGFSLGGIGATDAARAHLAENAFGFLNIVSYAIPTVLLAMAIFSFRAYYRAAGVTEEKIVQGTLLNLFLWTTAFLAALMLFATLFDFIYFAGADAVRGQTRPQCMLLSLRTHGILRLLFAPSAAVTVSLLYVVYDLIRVAIRCPRRIVFKIVLAAAIFLACCLYHGYLTYAAALTGSLADGAWLFPPDSVLPLMPIFPWKSDQIKDFHFLAAPVFNLAFVVGEFCFCAFVFGFVRVIGRCKNEIEKA